MSKELPSKPDKNEEVDLMLIFSAFEKLFKKIVNIFQYIFSIVFLIAKKVVIFFLFLINTIRRNFIKVLIPGIISIGIFYYLESTKPIVYSYNLLLKQNYETGKVLYRKINSFNSLAINRDSLALSREINIPIGMASKIKGFTISNIANQNNLMKEYFEFQKQTDSTTNVSYDNFVNQKNLEDYPLQSIRVTSSKPDLYKNLSGTVIAAILNNKYFENLKSNKLETINRKKELLSQLISESDSLQTNYFNLLKNYYGLKEESSKSSNSTINLTLESNKKDRINTKEYELFEESKRLKLEINSIEDEIKEKEELFVVLKDFSSPNVVEDDNNLPKKIPLALMSIVILLLLIKELDLIKKLDEFGTKEKLLEKNE